MNSGYSCMALPLGEDAIKGACRSNTWWRICTKSCRAVYALCLLPSTGSMAPKARMAAYLEAFLAPPGMPHMNEASRTTLAANAALTDVRASCIGGKGLCRS